jgi:hypothetical protein
MPTRYSILTTEDTGFSGETVPLETRDYRQDRVM